MTRLLATIRAVIAYTIRIALEDPHRRKVRAYNATHKPPHSGAVTTNVRP